MSTAFGIATLNRQDGVILDVYPTAARPQLSNVLFRVLYALSIRSTSARICDNLALFPPSQAQAERT